MQLAMKTLRSNSSITSNRQLDKHEAFKGPSLLVHDDDDDDTCSNKGCNLDHKTLAFFLSLDIESFNSNKDYEDRHQKDDLSIESPYSDQNGEAASEVDGSLVDTAVGLSNCGSISCRSSSRGSFTFPVLRSEWSDSPVRMVEAAGQKERQRWRSCFLCFKLRA